MQCQRVKETRVLATSIHGSPIGVYHLDLTFASLCSNQRFGSALQLYPFGVYPTSGTVLLWDMFVVAWFAVHSTCRHPTRHIADNVRRYNNAYPCLLFPRSNCVGYCMHTSMCCVHSLFHGRRGGEEEKKENMYTLQKKKNKEERLAWLKSDDMPYK